MLAKDDTSQKTANYLDKKNKLYGVQKYFVY